MNPRLFHWIAAVLVAAPLAAAAADGSQPKKTPIQFLLGGDQWQPGQDYRAGSDWLALVCAKSECSFEPAKLSVRKEQWQGHYDDQPTNGQQLTLRRQTPGAGRVLAWFRLNNEVPWLRPGPVATYPKKRPASQGTLEMAVDLPDGRQATLVPLLDRDDADDGRKKWQRNPKFLLQLRVPGQRQLLGEIGMCSNEVVTDYLVWAGDIDGDEKPDYLISGKLYLGGQAAQDEIAGVAAVAVYDQTGEGECDGEGWLWEFQNDK